MTGCKSGVSTRLKREQPLLFSMLAHRLELGFKAVVGANSFMTTFSELLFSIYNFYHSSALNRENLKSSCAAAGVKFLAPSRVWWYKVAASHHAGTKEAVEYVSSPNAALRAGKVILQTSTGINNLFFSCPLQQQQECLVIARPRRQRAFLKALLQKNCFAWGICYRRCTLSTLYRWPYSLQAIPLGISLGH